MATKNTHYNEKLLSSATVSGVIVAAGSGTRMGRVSKPEILLDGVSLFARVLQAFDGSCVQELVVVCGENRPRLEQIVLELQPSKPVRFCEGGKTRTESVFNGVNACAGENLLICVHDCARPFVTPEIIEAVISEARKSGAATACCPVTDTVKYVDLEHHAVYTPAREHLVALQTPQVFRRDFYQVAYAVAKGKGASYTDETAMLEAAGTSVAYVQTDPRNIKLTTREDLVLARAILAVQKAQNMKQNMKKGST